MIDPDIRRRVEELARDALEGSGAEIVELVVGGSPRCPVVRLFIDKEAGVSAADCARVSRSLEHLLDERGTLGEGYVLEVSSPGADRPLREPEDFRRFRGRPVRVTVRGEGKGERDLVGTLLGMEGDDVVLQSEEGSQLHLPLGGIVRAQLEVQFGSDRWGLARPRAGRDRARDRRRGPAPERGTSGRV